MTTAPIKELKHGEGRPTDFSVVTRKILQDIRDESRRKILTTTSEDWKDAWRELARAADRLDAMQARTSLGENRTTGD